MPADFKNEIHKWALECKYLGTLKFYLFYCIWYTAIALVALDTRLGCLQTKLAPDSEPQQIIDSVHSLLQCLHLLEIGSSRLWKFIPTPTWRKFVKTMDFFTELVNFFSEMRLFLFYFCTESV